MIKLSLSLLLFVAGIASASLPMEPGQRVKIPCHLLEVFERTSDEEIAVRATGGLVDAQTYLIYKYMPMVIKMVRKFSGGNRADDAANESNALMGLMDATRTYDISRNVLFKTHAQNRAKQEILRDWRRGGKTWKNTVQFDDRGPGDEEGSTARLERIEDEFGAPAVNESEWDWKLVKRRISRLLSKLDAAEKRIIRDRYLKVRPKSLTDIGADLGVSKTTVAKMETKALQKLAALLEDEVEGYVDFLSFEPTAGETLKRRLQIETGQTRNFFEFFANEREILFPLESEADFQQLITELLANQYGNDAEILRRYRGIGRKTAAYAEIASALGMSEEAVTTGIRRIIPKLRQRIVEDPVRYEPLLNFQSP